MLTPILLEAANFTPPQRTPWGGQRIVALKRNHGVGPELQGQPIGESWELSLGPELPSRTDDGRLLVDVIGDAPRAHLGAEADRGGSALLLKWIDARDNLSVQIHPAPDDPNLAAGETGKPECWYVVARSPGSAIYLGLRDGVSESEMRRALERGDDVSQLLQRIEVAPGDFFALAPGTPHALGAGIMLVEPQYVVPGKKALTLRYWDWNRRYDSAGHVDPNGKARELHVERALAATRWDAAGRSALEGKHSAFGDPPLMAAAKLELLCGPEPDAPVRCPELRVARLSGSGTLPLPRWDALGALTVLAGSVELVGEVGTLRVDAGRTAAIPAALMGLEARAEHAHALVCAAVP